MVILYYIIICMSELFIYKNDDDIYLSTSTSTSTNELHNSTTSSSDSSLDEQYEYIPKFFDKMIYCCLYIFDCCSGKISECYWVPGLFKGLFKK